MTREDPAVVIRPKFAEFWLVFGFPRLTQLNTLNASIRTWTLVVAPASNVLCRLRSTFFDPGPRRSLRSEFPNVPSAFGEYTEVLNQARIFSSVDLSDGNSGLPEMSARWLPVPLRALSTPL